MQNKNNLTLTICQITSHIFSGALLNVFIFIQSLPQSEPSDEAL